MNKKIIIFDFDNFLFPINKTNYFYQEFNKNFDKKIDLYLYEEIVKIFEFDFIDIRIIIDLLV